MAGIAVSVFMIGYGLMDGSMTRANMTSAGMSLTMAGMALFVFTAVIFVATRRR